MSRDPSNPPTSRKSGSPSARVWRRRPFAVACIGTLASGAAATLAISACSATTTPSDATTPPVATLPDGAPIPGRDKDAAPPVGDGTAPVTPTDGALPPGPGASGCKALAREQGVSVGGYNSDRYSWYDANCKLRTTALVRNNAADPGGSRGGYARVMTYETGGRTRTVAGTGANGWNGFGYLVNHFGSGGESSQNATGTFRSVLAGDNHAIHEFKTRLNLAGNVDVTVHWFFATGRSHPIYAVTYDATPAGANKVNADVRTPYGDMAWDEGPGSNGDTDGAGWGDKYRFVTTGKGPLTMNTAWDYRTPNTVPYTMLWANGANAEMGLVQTQTFAQQLAGGDYGGGILESDCNNKTSATKGANCADNGETMPKSWMWPFQMNQYELPFTTKSKRLAWGSSYGAIGQTQYWAFGANRSGYPAYGFSVAIVLGAHSDKAVEAQRIEIETVQATTFTASRGTVATNGPAGVGRADTVTYAPTGYNHIYGVWEVTAAANAVTASFAVASGALTNPVVKVRGYTGAPPRSVKLGGRVLTAGNEYFASVDPTGSALWITLNGTFTGTTKLEID